MAKIDNLVPMAQRYVRVLPSFADVDELLWFAAYDLVGALGYGDCVIYEIDRSIGRMRQAAAYGPKSPTRGTIVNQLEIPVGQGITGHAAITAQPVLVVDVTTDPRYVVDLAAQRSEVAVPILIGNDVHGVIDCEAPDVGAFTDADVEALTLIASLIAPKWEALRTRVVCSTKKRKLAEHNLYLSSQLEAARNNARNATHLHTTGTLMQLSGGLAHDFNNQLAIMRGALDVAAQRQGQLSPDLQLVSVAVERAAELTQRLLAFSSQQSLFPNCINFTEVIAEMGDLLAVSLETWISVATQTAPDLWDVNVDLGQLENAILNLVLNARDAMPEGGPIEIHCYNIEFDAVTPPPPTLTEGQYVVFSITDGGHGMPPEVQERAFDPYFTTKPRGRGTGLGLSMVYGFVRQSGGDVLLESTEGEGTTLKLYFPRYHAVESVETPVRSAAPLRYGDGEVILVIEDNVDFAHTVGEMLGLLRYRPVIANTAAEAVSIVAQSPAIAAVLTDITLDDGISVGALIEQLAPDLGDAPVIYMSGFAETGQQKVITNLNQQEFLQKPFAFDELASTLRQALERTTPG